MSAVLRARPVGVTATEQTAIDQAIEAGAELHRRGLLDDAERLYRGILKLAPQHFDATHLLGVVHQQRGNSDEALKLIGAAIELNAASADAYANHGKVLLQMRRFDEALASLDRAIALVPDHPQALINRAAICIEQKRYADAMKDATHVLEKDPQSYEGWTKRGNVMVGVGEREKALESFDKALAIKPDHIEALNNRGCLFSDLERTEEGLACYNRVLEINPRHAEAWINRGHMLVELHREEEGIESYLKAREVEPHHVEALYNEAINRLRLGDFRIGWEQNELRWHRKDFIHTQRNYPLPRWDGGAVDGPLLVSGEQGLGDQILYASILPDILKRTSQVVVEVEPRLVTLFARSFPEVAFVSREAALYTGPAVAQVHMASLGRFFRQDWQSFKHYPNGFLRPDPARDAQLRGRLIEGREKIVGLSWTSKNPLYELSKSARLHDFAPILRLPNCRFVDLQYGDTRPDREAVAVDLGVTVERMPDVDNTNDIDGLAALITACDVVVTTSNTTAHLAGALGKETYVLVPSGRGRMWYWFRGREDSPFYPRMHLRRQRPKQHWTELAGQIAAEIAAR